MKSAALLSAIGALGLAGALSLVSLAPSAPATRGSEELLWRPRRQSPAVEPPAAPELPAGAAVLESSSPVASRRTASGALAQVSATPGQVEIALSVDGGATSGARLRYRREGEEAWSLAESRAGRAWLPLDPQGEDSLEISVIGAAGEVIYFSLLEGDELEGWGQLSRAEVLRGSEAEWAPDGHVLEPDEDLVRVTAFGWRGVSGVVRDVAGRPAAGVEVFIRGRRTRTDARGRYLLERRIDCGADFLAVYACDGRGAFAGRRVPLEAFSGPASLQAGGVDLRLGRELTLRGKVSDLSGEPLEAYVEVAGQPRVRSAADGSYSVPGIRPDPDRRLPRSERVVKVWRAGYRPEEIKLEIRPGAPLDVTLGEARLREGRVVDEHGSPLSEVMVRVSNAPETAILERGFRSDEDWLETRTRQDGTFRLVATREQAFISAEAPGRIARRWRLGGPSGPLVLQLPARATIEGVLLGARGQPRHGQLLAVRQGDSPQRRQTPRPRFEGDLEPLPPPPLVAESYTQGGGFELRVEEGQTYDIYLAQGLYEAPVQVASGIEAGRRDLRIVRHARSPAALRLRVTSSAGGIAPPAEACFVGRGQEWLRRAEGGQLELSESQGGSYLLWLTAPGHRPLSKTVQLQDGQVTDLGEVVLQRGGGELEVVLPPREPFGAVFLDYRDPSGGPRLRAYADSATQTLRLSGLTSGLLELEVTLVDEDYSGTCDGGGDAFPRMVLEAVIREGSRERLEIPLPD